MKKKSSQFYLSSCCDAPTHVEGMPDFGDGDPDDVHTLHYVCDSCQKPCNPASKPAKKYWGGTPRSGMAQGVDDQLSSTTKEEYDYYINLPEKRIDKSLRLFSCFYDEAEKYNKLRHWQIVRKTLTIQRMIYLIKELENIFHKIIEHEKTKQTGRNQQRTG